MLQLKHETRKYFVNCTYSGGVIVATLTVYLFNKNIGKREQQKQVASELSKQASESPRQSPTELQKSTSCTTYSIPTKESATFSKLELLKMSDIEEYNNFIKELNTSSPSPSLKEYKNYLFEPGVQEIYKGTILQSEALNNKINVKIESLGQGQNMSLKYTKETVFFTGDKLSNQEKLSANDKIIFTTDNQFSLKAVAFSEDCN